MGLDKQYPHMLLLFKSAKKGSNKMKIKSLIKSVLGSKQEKRTLQGRLQHNDFFTKQAREQFLRLQKKGLSIPIATL